MNITIAIDGPSGAGKSTVARLLAKRLDVIYVDTGAMYRAVGYYFTQKGYSKEQLTTLTEDELEGISIELCFSNGMQCVLLNDKDVTDCIRVQSAAEAASLVATVTCVREKLVSMQKAMAEKCGLVMDGRDIGTVVLPNASVKIYLDATPLERARRRMSELRSKGIDANLDTLEQEIRERDYRDMNREQSPLKKADDAFYLNSDGLSVDEVLDRIMERVELWSTTH